MLLDIECPHCEADYKVPDTLLGKTIRCKACQGAIAVREPDDVEDDGEEEVVPVRRKKKKKKPSGPQPWQIAVAIVFALLAFSFVGFKIWRLTQVKDEAFANVPNAPNAPKFNREELAAPARVLPNNGQRVTDPDQLIAGKYPSAPKDRFTIDSPLTKGNRLEFNYTMLKQDDENPAQREMGRFGNGRRAVFMTDQVFIVVAGDGNIRANQLSSIRWDEQGTITLTSFGGAIPSGARVCLVIKEQRVSNVIVVP